MVLFLIQFAFPSRAQSGTLDLSFNTTGLLLHSLDTFGDKIEALAIQPDQKILFGGSHRTSYTASDFILSRSLPNGHLDSSFGINGSVFTYLEGRSEGHALALQNDGRIILGGSSQWYINLARYTNQGVLDTTFGTGGTVITDVIGYYSETCESIVIQSDGKILIAGYGKHNANDRPYVLLLRYYPNGNPDSSFGNNGVVIGGEGIAEAVALQSDGRIVLAGSYDFKMALWRFHPDGSVDTIFGSNGTVYTTLGTSCAANALKLLPNNKMLIAGYAYIDSTKSDFALLQYENNGLLDNNFGNGGVVTTSIGNKSAIAYGLDVQSNGYIVLGGRAMHTTPFHHFTLTRYDSLGQIDNSFGNNGIAFTPIGSGYSMGCALKIQSDEKIVLGGYTFTGPGTQMALARYDGSISLGLPKDSTLENLILYPNPIDEWATILIMKEEWNKADLVIVNDAGMVMRKMKAQSNMKIFRDHLPEGHYLLQLVQGNKVLSTVPFLILSKN